MKGDGSVARIKRTTLRGAILLIAALCSAEAGGQAQKEESRTNAHISRKAGEVVIESASLSAPDIETVDYELGTLYVPENRADPKSRIIGVGFARFRTTQTTGAPPSFHLPGGPGRSFLTDLPRMMKDINLYRRVSDVVIVDQRGFSRRG